MPVSWSCWVNQMNLPIQTKQAPIVLQQIHSHHPPGILPDTSIFLCSRISTCVIQNRYVYLAAIRLLHIEHNMPDPTDDHLLHLECRGIHRLQGNSQRIRLPITIIVLHTIKEQLRLSTYTVQEQRMLWAAFTTAFMGFWELVNLSALSGMMSSFHQTVSYTLHQSKTDPRF